MSRVRKRQIVYDLTLSHYFFMSNTEERRMIEMAKKRSAELRELEQGMDHVRYTRTRFNF